MLDRSAILRTAHSWARQAIRQDSFRHIHARRWPSYRAALADALRSAWRSAKARAAREIELAALAAAEEIEAAAMPADVVERVTDLRRFAETMPITATGNRRYGALLAEANDLAAAARCAIITGTGQHAHAH